MALFPCERHGGRYKGKQVSLYLGVGTSADIDRTKLRLCGDCFDEVAEGQLSALVKVVEDDTIVGDYQAPFECLRCNAEVECVPVFVTAYPRGEGQSQWFGRLCPPCAADFREALSPLGATRP